MINIQPSLKYKSNNTSIIIAQKWFKFLNIAFSREIEKVEGENTCKFYT